MKKASIAILTLFLAFGCHRSAPATTSNDTTVASSQQQQAALTPEELGELGAKIKQHPGDAQKLLSEKGLTGPSFEQAIRRVAESPEASKRYAAAYKKAQA